MTEKTDTESLKFRMKKADMDWGQSQDNSDSPPNHIAKATAIVLHPYLKKRPSNKAKDTSFTITP